MVALMWKVCIQQQKKPTDKFYLCRKLSNTITITIEKSEKLNKIKFLSQVSDTIFFTYFIYSSFPHISHLYFIF